MTNVGASFCKSLSSFKIQIHNNLTSKRKNPNEEHNKGYKTTNREIHKAIKRIEEKQKLKIDINMKGYQSVTTSGKGT
jgi:hypothetical protein